MARRPAKKAPKEAVEFEFIGFVNITLTDNELAEVDRSLSEQETDTFPPDIEALLELGKVSLNYVKGSVNVALTVMEGVAMGYAVSAWGEDVKEATHILRYKVHKYLDKFEEIYKGGGNTRRRG